MATARTRELRRLAARIADALPPGVGEVVVTGSVSRGVADDVSDIELLVVTSEPLELDECFEHARRVGLERLDTWGPQGTETKRVFGYLDDLDGSRGQRALRERARAAFDGRGGGGLTTRPVSGTLPRCRTTSSYAGCRR